MKKATSCIICGKPVRESFGYKVRLWRRYESPITGETETERLEGLACPICNRRMGYSGSEKKLERYKKSRGEIREG